jgi:hypothetical protein
VGPLRRSCRRWLGEQGGADVGDVITAPVGRRLVGGRVPLDRVVLAVSLVALNLADVLLTRMVLDRGGVEANPLMRELMTGLAAPLGLKAVVAGTAAALLLACPLEARLGERAAAMVTGLYVAIVTWNAAVFGWLVLSS